MTAPSRSCLLLLISFLVSLAPATAARIVIDDSDRVVLDGSVPVRARPESEIGRSSPSLPMERVILLLRRRPGAEADLERLLAAQHDPSSPLFHHWLTPEEFGARFGLADDDIAAVTDWLRAQGFSIDEVATGRGWVNFSGTAAQVEQAFRTEMHDYQVDGKLRHANATEPSLPRALTALVHGVVSLNNFESRPLSRVMPGETNLNDGSHALAPADFATIYHLGPAYGSGLTGTGQTIAIVARTDIQLSDVRTFRSSFGLPAKDPVFVHNGPDPGVVSGEEGEADLDTEWSGAVARNATIKVVISKTTNPTDGVDLSAQYIVNHDLAPVMSTSFGLCEDHMGSSNLAFYNSLWSQAAAQGITSFVSSGDSGAAGCDAPSSGSGSGRAVSGLCTTPFDVCVGGSQFNDTSNPGAFWATSNDPTTKASALSYIPEIAWNESAHVAGGDGLWSTGGGASNVYSKPSFQSAPGVPTDGQRDVPDVALTAADHDGYLGYSAGNLVRFSGTSASSPAFAGILALVVQSTGARQGNANTVFYPMATRQLNGTGPTVFHDIKSGNNTVPGTTGFSAGTGYDRVTGLGSVDASALITNWSGSSIDTSPCTAGDTTLCIDDQSGDQRFEVKVAYQTTQGGGSSGQGHAIPLGSLGVGHGGLLWFFGADNPEMLIKVINGCGAGGHYWVFYAAGTNVGLTTTVRDTHSGITKTYTNPDRTAAPPIQDTAAFACGAADIAAATPWASAAAPDPIPSVSGALGSCVPDAHTLCINNRFKIQVAYQTSQGGGHSGSGNAIPLSSLGVSGGGLLWFFGADNPEMLIKIVDGCALNNHRWVFYSAGTNVGLTTTVTDTQTSAVQVYTNQDLHAAAPEQDITAFACN